MVKKLQPMSTAPKDGTWIKLHNPAWNFQKAKWVPESGGYWMGYGGYIRFDNTNHYQPTGWVKLKKGE